MGNKTFMAIWAICFAVQCLLVEIGAIGKTGIDLQCDAHNMAFRTTHLTGTQWVLCLVCGIFSMPWQWVLITIAKRFFPDMGRVDVYALAGHWEDTDETAEKSAQKHKDEGALALQKAEGTGPAAPNDKYKKGVHPEPESN